MFAEALLMAHQDDRLRSWLIDGGSPGRASTLRVRHESRPRDRDGRAGLKLLYTVQRYGEDIVGGSEAACRQFAEHLAQRGHHVEVVTSCARSYLDWADEYEAGSTESTVCSSIVFQ